MTYMPQWGSMKRALRAHEVSFENPFEVYLVPDHHNEHDIYACRILWPSDSRYGPHAPPTLLKRMQLGWVPRDLTQELNAYMEGLNLDPLAYVVEVDVNREPRPLVRIVLAL